MEEQKRPKRDRIGIILYSLYVLMLVASVVLIGRLVYIQVFWKPEPKIAGPLTQRVSEKSLEPVRGNILAQDGRLLAMTYPQYQVYMDCTVRKDEFAQLDPDKKAFAEQRWADKAKALSEGLSDIFPDKSAEDFYSMIMNGRKSGRRYLKIGTPVERPTYMKIKSLPLFNEGAGRGGLIPETQNIRRYPYGKLARRTIGFIRSNKSDVGNTHVGLEGKYDEVLSGTTGSMWRKITDAGMVQNYDSAYVKAIDGDDIRTTINIDYQDIADRAMRTQLQEEVEIEGGCCVLMDVKTGAIRAIVNLLRDPKTGALEESQNLAIGRLGEPGSVFKITTLMTALEARIIHSLDDKIPSNHGVIKGYRYEQDRHIVDYERENHCDSVPMLYCVQVSSNYGFRYLAINNYEKRPKEFLSRLYDYKLGEAFDFDLDGFGKPQIPSPDSPTWTKMDLGQIAMGYSVLQTPMHILTFYNAIANKGKMMKPYLVEDIEKNGMVKEKKGPSVLNPSICSKATADTITRGLRKVTEEGTATRLKKAKCTVAGKTGTSRAVLDNGRYEDESGRKKNQGTFVGFFPAEDPQYSIICVVYSTLSHRSFYGGTIPALVVKDVVDGVYNIDPYWEEHLKLKKK